MRLPSFNHALAPLTAVLVLPLGAQAPPDEGEATKITVDPVTGTTHQTHFNPFGQLTRLVQQDPGGKAQTRQFTYDHAGRLTSQTEPETQTTTFGDFDALGQPGTVTDASHRTIRRTFDGLGRLQSVNGGSLSLSAFYQGPFLGGRSSADGVDQTFTYGGPEGRMDTETLTIDGVKRSLGYGYDSNGRLAQVTYPSGRVVGYSYDRLGRISQITNNDAPLVEVGYEERGARTSLSFASGAKSVWTLDESGQHWQTWTVAFAGGSETRKYQHDALNHLTEAGEWTLQHDARGRLTSARGFGLSASYGYDAFGNNTVHTLSGSHPSTFNAFFFDCLADNRIPGIQANGALTGWVIQANGEASQVGTGVSSDRCLNLCWDDLGRLAEVTDSLTGAGQRYRYAPSGLRVSLTDSSDASRDRQFLYTDDGLLLGEYQGNGDWKRDVIYLGAQAIAEVDGRGVHELHPDHLGTPRVITSGYSAAVEGRQAFGPYGELFDTGNTTTTGYRPLTGYTGHLQPDATGLIYMRGRFYSPAWHRFLNADYGVDPRSWNQFAYVGGSPFHRVDPTGFMDGSKDHGGFKWDGGDRYSATVEVHGDLREVGRREGGRGYDRTPDFPTRSGDYCRSLEAREGNSQVGREQTLIITPSWIRGSGGTEEPPIGYGPYLGLNPLRPLRTGVYSSGRPMPTGAPMDQSALLSSRLAPARLAQTEQAWLSGKTGPWPQEGIPPLTDAERFGYKPAGNPMGPDVPPLQPRANQDLVSLVSRPVTGGLGLLVSHTATIIQANGKDYIIQSGPANDGSGLNVATIGEVPAGQGLAEFAKGAAVSTSEARWFVPSGKISEAQLQALVSEWNSRQLKYFEPGKSMPTTTCNTFSKWLDRRIGLKLPSDMATPVLYGWTKEIE